VVGCVEGIVVDQNQALRFALDVARGMEFLHSMEPLIPNLTLNSKHIMVICESNTTIAGQSSEFLIFSCVYLVGGVAQCWRHCLVVRTSVLGRQTFPDLCPIYG